MNDTVTSPFVHPDADKTAAIVGGVRSTFTVTVVDASRPDASRAVPVIVWAAPSCETVTGGEHDESEAPAGPQTKVTVTAALCQPAAFGGCDSEAEIVGGPASGDWIAKPAVREASCTPVFAVTVRGPAEAVGDATICATAVVGDVTVTGPATPSAAPPTRSPAPKLATVAPWTKFVYSVLMVTVADAPARTFAGEMETIFGGGFTVSVAAFELANCTPAAVAPLTLTE